MVNFSKFKVSLVLGLLISNSPAFSDEITVLSYTGKEVKSEDIVHDLTLDEKNDLPQGLLPKDSSGEVKYRGIVFKQKKDIQKLEVNSEKHKPEFKEKKNSVSECPAIDKAIAIDIRFALDSYEVTADIERSLVHISDAMNHKKLKNCFFIVEGHTDSTGTPEYNLYLSEQRAISVRNYLIKNNVDKKRLLVVGKGETEPLDLKNINSSVNRRVQFTVGKE